MLQSGQGASSRALLPLRRSRRGGSLELQRLEHSSSTSGSAQSCSRQCRSSTCLCELCFLCSASEAQMVEARCLGLCRKMASKGKALESQRSSRSSMGQLSTPAKTCSTRLGMGRLPSCLRQRLRVRRSSSTRSHERQPLPLLRGSSCTPKCTACQLSVGKLETRTAQTARCSCLAQSAHRSESCLCVCGRGLPLSCCMVLCMLPASASQTRLLQASCHRLALQAR